MCKFSALFVDNQSENRYMLHSSFPNSMWTKNTKLAVMYLHYDLLSLHDYPEVYEMAVFGNSLDYL
jgi:hypothetical protein